MPTPTARPAIGTTPIVAETIPPGKEPRGARRKRETRQRLLEAALQLMARKGMDGVTINEITEAADVGFGSFYNHFESKETIYAALTDWVFEEFADALDNLVAHLDDPAEVIAVSVRHALIRARREPVWGQFLIREGFSARIPERGLGYRLLRDIQNGIGSGRFATADPLMSLLSIGGTVLATISAQLWLVDAQGRAGGELATLGFDASELPERAAAVSLHILGVSPTEAAAIARRPLPSGAGEVVAG